MYKTLSFKFPKNCIFLWNLFTGSSNVQTRIRCCSSPLVVEKRNQLDSENYSFGKSTIKLLSGKF